MNNNIVQIIKYAWALITLVYLSSSCPHVNRRYDQVSKTCVPQEHVFSGWHLPSDALREIAWYDWKSDHTLLFVLLDYLSSGRRKVSLWSFSNRTHTNVRIHSRLENFLTQQVDFPEDIIMSPNHRELLCPVGCVDEDAVAIVSLSSETIRFYTYLPHGVDFLIGWWPNSRGWLYRDAYNRIYLVSVTKGGPQKVSYLLRDDASPKWKALSEASVQDRFQVLPKAKYLLKAAVYNLPHEDTCNGSGGHLIYFV